MFKIVVGSAIVLGFYVWVIRGAMFLRRLIDNPPDSRERFGHRKVEGFKWSDEE